MNVKLNIHFTGDRRRSDLDQLKATAGNLIKRVLPLAHFDTAPKVKTISGERVHLSVKFDGEPSKLRYVFDALKAELSAGGVECLITHRTNAESEHRVTVKADRPARQIPLFDDIDTSADG